MCFHQHVFLWWSHKDPGKRVITYAEATFITCCGVQQLLLSATSASIVRTLWPFNSVWIFIFWIRKFKLTTKTNKLSNTKFSLLIYLEIKKQGLLLEWNTPIRFHLFRLTFPLVVKRELVKSTDLNCRFGQLHFRPKIFLQMRPAHYFPYFVIR